jgi:hypothetical protein
MRIIITSVGFIAFAAAGWLFLAVPGDRTAASSDQGAVAGPSTPDPDTRITGGGPSTGPSNIDNVAMKIISEATPSTPPRQPKKPAAGATESNGPWGSLQSYNVYIAAPDHIVALFPVPSAVSAWKFIDMGEEDVAKILNRPDIPAEVRSQLLDRSRWLVTDNNICVTPPNDAILAIPAEARAAIYATLSKWALNEFQHSPYYVADGDVDAWLSNTGLRGELVDVIRRTVYPRGKCFWFSDVSLVVALTTSHSEARTLLKALSRTRTSILRVRLEETSDTKTVASYWSAGDANAKDFLPLLESVASNPDVHFLDVVHLLPPYARKLLYTYPHQSLAIDGHFPDCHWTTLNFFNYRPEARFLDTDGALMYIVENFVQGDVPYRYGDTILLIDDRGRGIHSCVYIADDYVFTKNGSNLISPWLIMKLQEVVDLDSVNGDTTVRILRKAR